MVYQRTLRIIGAFVLASTGGLVMSGCVLVPARPAYVAPAPPVVVVPGPPVYGYHYYGYGRRW